MLNIKLSQNKTYKEVERNIPECKKFIQDFVDKVIVFKDHVEVIFNVVFSVAKGETVYKKVVHLSKEDMFEKYTM